MLDTAQTPESPVDHYRHSSAQGFTLFHAVGRSSFISTAISSEGCSRQAKFSIQPWQMQKPGYDTTGLLLTCEMWEPLISPLWLHSEHSSTRIDVLWDPSLWLAHPAKHIATTGFLLHSTDKYLISEKTCPFWLCILEKVKICKSDSFSKKTE